MSLEASRGFEEKSVDRVRVADGDRREQGGYAVLQGRGRVAVAARPGISSLERMRVRFGGAKTDKYPFWC